MEPPFKKRKPSKETRAVHFTASLPDELLEKLESAGANIDRRGKELEGLPILITCRADDPASALYHTWCSEMDGDPHLTVFWGAARGVVPPLNQVGPILLEASSLVAHVSTLKMSDFGGQNAPLPPVPHPLQALPHMPIHYHHASIAAQVLVSYLQSPPATYPVINNLGSGTYICTLHSNWSNATVLQLVYKG